MGPRRQLGLSITFVDDDEVMSEGKGSPLGIAAIALVGDDAMRDATAQSGTLNFTARRHSYPVVEGQPT